MSGRLRCRCALPAPGDTCRACGGRFVEAVAVVPPTLGGAWLTRLDALVSRVEQTVESGMRHPAVEALREWVDRARAESVGPSHPDATKAAEILRDMMNDMFTDWQGSGRDLTATEKRAREFLLRAGVRESVGPSQPDGPWFVLTLISEPERYAVEKAHAPGNNGYVFDSEAEALAVRDALNRVAALASREGADKR